MRLCKWCTGEATKHRHSTWCSSAQQSSPCPVKLTVERSGFSTHCWALPTALHVCVLYVSYNRDYFMPQDELAGFDS